MDSIYSIILYNSVHNLFNSEDVNEAIHLGNLGLQYCIRTEAAYNKLHRIYSTSYAVDDYNSKLEDYNTRIETANTMLHQMEVNNYDG